MHLALPCPPCPPCPPCLPHFPVPATLWLPHHSLCALSCLVFLALPCPTLQYYTLVTPHWTLSRPTSSILISATFHAYSISQPWPTSCRTPKTNWPLPRLVPIPPPHPSREQSHGLATHSSPAHNLANHLPPPPHLMHQAFHVIYDYFCVTNNQPSPFYTTALSNPTSTTNSAYTFMAKPDRGCIATAR